MLSMGLSPVPEMGDDVVPAMTLCSQVALFKRVPCGDGVSDGNLWHTDRKTTLALVPADRANGMPGALTGRLEVWLAGRRGPVVRRVCMDLVMVDCGDGPASGSSVTPARVVR